MRVMLVVTHLLGAGHLNRARIIAEAFAHAGHKVQLISGGMPVPHFTPQDCALLQLPPIKSDGINFTRLLTVENRHADAAYLRSRAAMLVDAVQSFQPDCLITELFPFGRRSLSDEFLALLQAAQTLPKAPLIYASVRDILAPPSKPAKAARAEQILQQFYDGVLVHADAAITKLAESWPVSDALENKLLYTGYIAPKPAGKHPESLGKGEILVAAGSGNVGLALYQTAIKAAALSLDNQWRLLVGGSDGAQTIQQLLPMITSNNIIIEPARPDYRQMLHHAAASVSLCGYNTALDLLSAGTPAILVPFDERGETEQTTRAKSLMQNPQFQMITSADLSPDILLKTIQHIFLQMK